MKRAIFRFWSVILFLLAQIALPLANVHASADDFFFESFDVDFYITKDTEGVSLMHVKERIVAIFPEDIDQNHGITRSIPYTNNNGKNVVVSSTDKLNFSVTLNGKPENFTISRSSDSYDVRIGNASTYVHGRQVYELEYDFENVILGYDANGNSTYIKDDIVNQELYWDTNGTDGKQIFNSVSARVHFQESEIPYITGNASCYVGTSQSTNGLSISGTFGTNDYVVTPNNSNTPRCEIAEISDGYAFRILDVAAPRENLTIDIDLAPGAFTILRIEDTNKTSHESKPYVFLPQPALVMGLTIMICGIVLIVSITGFCKVSDKRNYYKTLPTPPQYTPHPTLSIAESAELYMGKVHTPQVASLINAAVKGNIELIRMEKRFFGYKWRVRVKSLTDENNLTTLNPQDRMVLEILNGGSSIEPGDEFNIKHNSYSSHIESLNRRYTNSAISNLQSYGMLNSKAKKSKTKQKNERLASTAITLIVVTVMPLLMMSVVFDVADVGGSAYADAPFVEFFLPVMFFTILITVILRKLLRKATLKYKTRTLKGLETANYLDGLKLYMQMAEADRIRFLQSVQNVDTSPEGIVKLHEKLLPFAILFGIEQSWVKEMQQYYQFNNISPDWCNGDIQSLYVIRSLSSSTISSIRSGSIQPSESGGGGWNGSSGGGSSSSSGGGGGGSSGGGGGGGGVGGW